MSPPISSPLSTLQCQSQRQAALAVPAQDGLWMNDQNQPSIPSFGGKTNKQKAALLKSPVLPEHACGRAQPSKREGKCPSADPEQPPGASLCPPRPRPGGPFPSLTEASGVRAGSVKALNAASLTERVLSFVRVERVCGYALRSLSKNRQNRCAPFTKKFFFGHQRNIF